MFLYYFSFSLVVRISADAWKTRVRIPNYFRTVLKAGSCGAVVVEVLQMTHSPSGNNLKSALLFLSLILLSFLQKKAILKLMGNLDPHSSSVKFKKQIYRKKPNISTAILCPKYVKKSKVLPHSLNSAAKSQTFRRTNTFLSVSPSQEPPATLPHAQ